MRIFTFLISYSIIIFSGISCSPTQAVEAKKAPATQPDEYINLTINEAVEFNFIKVDSIWSGELTFSTLNKSDEKVVKRKLVSVPDSTWQDFDLFVHFLDLYNIEPQHKIEGWIPASKELPQRVYNFEVFDGDSTASYSYQDPQKELQKYWQSQNVLTFVTYVQTELSWKKRESDR